MRMPEALREAATIAVKGLGVAPSVTTLTFDALRARLEALVMEATLEAHYIHNPDARPDLGELAVAAAELDGNPLASRPELLHQAAREIVSVRPGADADDVVLWAQARALSPA